MSENKPALSTRYFLTLEESQDGFALATFGKKQMTRFITPLISVGIIVWGFMLRFFRRRSLLCGIGYIFLGFTNSHALLVSADDV